MGKQKTDTLLSGEAASRSSLKLSGDQEELLEAVVGTGKPVVLVLVNGRPLDISWAAEHVPAIVETWYSTHVECLPFVHCLEPGIFLHLKNRCLPSVRRI